MDFRTLVPLPAAVPPRLQLGDGVMLLGSCFAEEVGRHLQRALPPDDVVVNPFGVLYNPESLHLALHHIIYGSLFFPEEFLFQGSDGLWHSWLHSGAYSDAKRDVAATHMRQALERAARLLPKTRVLCLTFGTNRAYVHRTEGFVVGNCHKEPADHFEVKSLTAEDIVSLWSPLLADLEKDYPNLHTVFTVSPHRYAAYGLHESQLAKAQLLLAVDALCTAHRNAFYFPAYEIVLDELRDYRFFADDMLHPSPQAAAYVYERFATWLFSPLLTEYVSEHESLLRAEAHRPLHPDSEAHRKFLKTLEKKRAAFNKKWHS